MNAFNANGISTQQLYDQSEQNPFKLYTHTHTSTSRGLCAFIVALFSFAHAVNARTTFVSEQ